MFVSCMMIIAFFFLAWISYLNVAMLLGTFALALFNASRDQIALNFAYFYAIVSVGIMVRENEVT